MMYDLQYNQTVTYFNMMFGEVPQNRTELDSHILKYFLCACHSHCYVLISCCCFNVCLQNCSASEPTLTIEHAHSRPCASGRPYFLLLAIAQFLMLQFKSKSSR